MEGFVQVPADAYGAAAAVQRSLYEVGDFGFPGAGLPGDDNHDRLLLRDGVPGPGRQNLGRQDLFVLPLGQDDRHDVLVFHRTTSSARPAACLTVKITLPENSDRVKSVG